MPEGSKVNYTSSWTASHLHRPYDIVNKIEAQEWCEGNGLQSLHFLLKCNSFYHRLLINLQVLILKSMFSGRADTVSTDQ